MLETRVLRYFLAVAREGSITAAAQSLHVTQPTLSRQLMDLEDELGQKLFVRGAHHVSLTPEGILLRKRASEILELVGKTVELSCGDTRADGAANLGERCSHQLVGGSHQLNLVFSLQKYH